MKEQVITSYPGPDKSIKKSDLDRGRVIARRYRNRRIGEFLKELRLTEGRSTGIPKIIRSMENNGSSAPIFDTDDDRTYFLVELPINKYFLQDKYDEAQDEAQDEKNDLSDIEKKILIILLQNTVAKDYIIQKLGYKSVAGNIKRAFEKLLQHNLIEYTIPEKPRSKNQKYRITQKGENLLNLLSE